MADKYASIELRLNDYMTNGFNKAKSAAISATESFKTNVRQVNLLGDSYKAIGTSILGVFAADRIMRFSQDSIKAYEGQRLAIAKLDSALGYSSKALYQHAAAIQANTTFGDETVTEAHALIASFIKEENQIKRVTEAAVDLAAAKGMDLNSAADLLTKTISSEMNALGRYGIKVEGQVGSERRLQSAIEGVNKAYGGRAAAIANTDVGKIQQTRNAIGDIQELIGEKILPAQLEWNKAVLIGVGYVDKLLSGYQKYASILGALSGGSSLGRITVQNTIDSSAGMKKSDAQALLGTSRLNIANDIRATEKAIAELEAGPKNSIRSAIEKVNESVADGLGLQTKRERLIADQKKKLSELRIESQMLGDALKQFEKTGTGSNSDGSSTVTKFNPNRKLTLDEEKQVYEWFKKQQDDSYEDAKKQYEKRIELVKQFEELARKTSEDDAQAIWQKKHDLEEETTRKAKEESDKRARIAEEEASRIDQSFTNMRTSLIDSAEQLSQYLIKSMFGEVDEKKEKNKAHLMTAVNFAISHGAAAAKIWSTAKTWQEGLAESIGVSAGLFTQEGIAHAAINKYALGTNYSRGGRAVVGERGPEIIDLPTGSRVIPNNQTSSQQPTIHITFHNIDNSGNISNTLHREFRNGDGSSLVNYITDQVKKSL